MYYDIIRSTDISAEAVRKRMEEDLSSGVKSLAMDDDMEKPESERINIFHAFLKIKTSENGYATIFSSSHCSFESTKDNEFQV